MFIILASDVPAPSFKWKNIWKTKLNTYRTDLINELKFDLTNSAFTEMVQCKVLNDNEFDSIKVLTNPTDRANRLYEEIETRSAKTILTLIGLLKKYSRHETLAAELERFYNESVDLYYR